ncbi:MAG: 2-C-methyl-D-erythritol 4-phosphate cytidylyltransferase [Frankiaceae bacterium]|nr:2-C-methyl-D-erythritol 4-phosphate cytidylyltransferase [Frankiaceae bacterium]MBV9368504.1 2-C-methyl-D-erythritol 4-phosphate cytidylyltransferase [Frankiales bacterium]
MRVAGIVPAAGRGERLGHPVPKALVHVGALPLVVHAIATLMRAGADPVVVAAPPDAIEEVRRRAPRAVVVPGGAHRWESVRLALAAVPADIDAVLVHDAARPLTPDDVVQRVMAALAAGASAAIPALPLADTVKRVDGDGAVVETVDRTTLRAVQTPQGFRRDVLADAHAAADAATLDVTDDAALVEAMGVDVLTVAGDPRAFKVTTPWDLAVAELIWERGMA